MASTEKNFYQIYQVKSGPEYRDYRYSDIHDIHNLGLGVDQGNYDLVYEERLPARFNFDRAGGYLNKLFDKFNIDCPDDFMGHSLSVSDVIVLSVGGKARAYFTEVIGFSVVDNFVEYAPDNRKTIDGMNKNACEAADEINDTTVESNDIER